MGRALTRLIDHTLRIRVRFCNDLLITLFRSSEFLADLFGVELAFFDFSPALFEDCDDRFVSKPSEQVGHDAEANDLREKQFPIPAERVSGFAQNIRGAPVVEPLRRPICPMPRAE